MQDNEAAARCGSWSIVGGTDEERIVIPLRCRRWTCPRCGVAMRNRMVHLVGLSAPTSLLTLTCDPSLYRSPEAAFDAMSRGLPKLVQRLRRRIAPAAFEYLAVWELTKAGWPHLHLIIRAPYLPQGVIAREWRELTGARIVDIRAVWSSPAAARYVGKYLTKQLERPTGKRHWRSSAGFFPEPFRPRKGTPTKWGIFTIARAAVHEVVWEMRSRGYLAVELPDGSVELHKPAEIPLWMITADYGWFSRWSAHGGRASPARAPT